MRHTKSTRRARGATMVESLIVICLLTVILAVGIFLHGLFIGKMAAMRDSRSAAWQNVGQCRGGLTGAIVASPVDLINRLSDPDRLEQGDELFTPGMATEIRIQQVDKPGILQAQTGPNSYRMTSESRVACNEHTAPQGDLASIFQWGFTELVPSR